MDKVERYRQVFLSFKELCSTGRQPSSFSAYCKANSVDQCQMRQIFKNEFQNIKTLPGYRSISHICSVIYEDFKQKCADGRQPGTFADFYRSHGITWEQMHGYLKRNKLKVVGLPGYVMLTGGSRSRCQEIPFEDVIFEEAGFLPADTCSTITVKVDGHVAVSFPPDTDVAVIARFVRKLGKEVGDVGA